MAAMTNLCSLSPRNKGLPDVPDVEDRGSFDVVPVLLREGIDPAKHQADHKIESEMQRRTGRSAKGTKTHAFFFPPFFPLEIRLFFLERSKTHRKNRKI